MNRLGCRRSSPIPNVGERWRLRLELRLERPSPHLPRPPRRRPFLAGTERVKGKSRRVPDTRSETVGAPS
ncbi:hypothetical protein BKA15_003048 [Microlunatus parietis]|uniref:Uncharacterized protein n=1 Tax=Microlunatus parietis TaxID=682979 RepID=A0A7Y9I8L6_9ACTN|nr:hypothetical protein [Microlunatus parietis]